VVGDARGRQNRLTGVACAMPPYAARILRMRCPAGTVASERALFTARVMSGSLIPINQAPAMRAHATRYAR